MRRAMRISSRARSTTICVYVLKHLPVGHPTYEGTLATQREWEIDEASTRRQSRSTICAATGSTMRRSAPQGRTICSSPSSRLSMPSSCLRTMSSIWASGPPSMEICTGHPRTYRRGAQGAAAPARGGGPRRPRRLLRSGALQYRSDGCRESAVRHAGRDLSLPDTNLASNAYFRSILAQSEP